MVIKLNTLTSKKFLIAALLLCVVLPFVIGCDNVTTPTSDQQQQSSQEHMSQQSNQEIGMPGISNFEEKRIMRRLYEMRDKNIATYTYLVDMNGQLHHVCDSMGYGLPYATQYSNPEKRIAMTGSDPYHGDYSLPQSEPNGLFMPSTAEGTWVICASNSGQFTPMYLEPRVIVSPFRLNSVGDYALPGEKNEALKKTETIAPYKPAIGSAKVEKLQ